MAESLGKKELKDWKNKLSISNSHFDAYVKENVKKYRNYYKGEQLQFNDDNELDFRDNSIANMVYTNISTIIPSIIFKNPRLYVTALKKPWQDKGGGLFDTVAAAQAFEVLVNYYYKQLKLKRQTEKCTYDALLGPWGIMKLGYTAQTEKVKDGKELEINEIIKEESIFAHRLSPMDFRVDSKAKDHLLEDAEWVAFRWERSLSDVKRMDIYSNTANLKPNKTIDTNFNSVTLAENKPEQSSAIWDVVEGWDIWDKKEKKIITIVPEHEKELQLRSWPWDINGFPCEVLYFNENPDELYPLSDVETYLGEQDELNLMRSILLDGARRMSEQKWLSRREAMAPDEKWKLTHGGSGVIAEVDGDPTTAITPIRNTVLSQDVLLATRMLKGDIRERSGVASFERGIAEKFDTATEASLVQQGISIAREHRRDVLEDFTLRIIKKLSMILQQTLSDIDVPLNPEQFTSLSQRIPEKLHKITGEQGIALLPWLKLSKNDLRGDYDFTMELGSMQPVNKETRKRDALQLAQVLAGNPFINPVESLKRVFEAFEVRDFEKLMRDPNQVMQEQQQQQQAAVQAEIAKDSPKREADLQKTKIKSETALAAADKKNEGSLIVELIKNLSNAKNTGK